MKAITVQQPWAELIILGRQIWITKQHKTEYTGRIAIVSAKNMDKNSKRAALTRPLADILPHPRMLPRQQVVGFASLVSCKPALLVHEMFILPNYATLGSQTDFGIWEHGWYAYEFRNPERLVASIAARGSNHIWEFSDEKEQEVEDAYEGFKEAADFHACPTCKGTGVIKCDGNHAGRPCGDKDCWLRE